MAEGIECYEEQCGTCHSLDTIEADKAITKHTDAEKEYKRLLEVKPEPAIEAVSVGAESIKGAIRGRVCEEMGIVPQEQAEATQIPQTQALASVPVAPVSTIPAAQETENAATASDLLNSLLANK